MSENKDKTVVLGDLFKVYFLWDRHFYIELLRPLESRDFTVLHQEGNAIHFIKDSDWFYTHTYSHRANGDKYNLVHKATLSIQLSYKDELIACLQDNLPSVFDSQIRIDDLCYPKE